MIIDSTFCGGRFSSGRLIPIEDITFIIIITVVQSPIVLQASELPGLVLVGVQGPLHFANRDNFRASLEEASGIHPAAIKKEKKAAASKEDANAGPDASKNTVKVI